MFHKSFVTFERFSAYDAICQNSRIYQLDKYFDIKRNIVPYGFTAMPVPDAIDYDEFEIKLKDLKDDSIQYLKKSLGDV